MPNLYRTQQTHTIQPDTIPDQIKQELVFAKNHVENGDYDEAIVSYKKIISLNLKIDNFDKNIGFYSRLGDLYQSQGRLSDAIAAYTKAIDISKQLPSESVEQGIYINRIKCLLESPSPDNLEIIIEDCNNLIEINKNNGCSQKNVAVYVDLGKTYFKQDKIELAIDSYKKAISLASDEMAIGAYVELGNLHELQGDDDAAFSCYTSAINSADNLEKTIAPRIRLADLYRKQEKFTEAESIYNQIISSCSIPDKKKLGAYNNLGKLYPTFIIP